jgi:hypothetical protein
MNLPVCLAHPALSERVRADTIRVDNPGVTGRQGLDPAVPDTVWPLILRLGTASRSKSATGPCGRISVLRRWTRRISPQTHPLRDIIFEAIKPTALHGIHGRDAEAFAASRTCCTDGMHGASTNASTPMPHAFTQTDIFSRPPPDRTPVCNLMRSQQLSDCST